MFEYLSGMTTGYSVKLVLSTQSITLSSAMILVECAVECSHREQFLFPLGIFIVKVCTGSNRGHFILEMKYLFNKKLLNIAIGDKTLGL